MAFTLKVTAGNGSGEEFAFDGGEARLGRTADNNVVIKDPSSSRSHARVYEENGAWFVEDMKSANGTKLNGRTLKAPAALSSGDVIAIGDVQLKFTGEGVGDETVLKVGSATVDDVEETVDPNATLLKPGRVNLAALPGVSSTLNDDEEAPAASSDNDEPAPAALNDEEPDANSTKAFEVPPPRALQKRPESGSSSPVRRPSRAAPAAVVPAAPAISAAERLRQRRELQKSGATGKAQLFWNDLPRPAQIGLMVVGSLVGLGLLAAVVNAMLPKDTKSRIETHELKVNAERLADSYGLGEGVDFKRPDMKAFTFTVLSPTAVVGVLHYQASDISKDEVSIELNGAALTTVPPDTIDVTDRELEEVLPSKALRLGTDEPNELVFDNVNNPPGDDTWRVWNIWVEIIPIPQLSVEEAAVRAKADLDRAAKLYQDREIGALNLFRAWKLYRDAWLILEATPGRPQELLVAARTRMREIRPELDRKCSGMKIDFQKEYHKKEYDLDVLRNIAQNINNHFEKEHPCYGWSRYVLKTIDGFE